MSVRRWVEEKLDTLLDFGAVTASTVASAAKSIEVTIKGDEDAEGNAEEVSESELWGSAAILMRPADPDDAGQMEVVYWRRGDELVGIASKDRRWQVDLEKGEVVVRSLGDGGARVRLHPDGTATLEAANVKVGANASEAIALGDALKTWLDNHRHTYSDNGAPTLTSPPQGPSAGTPDPSPAPSSKHTVES